MREIHSAVSPQFDRDLYDTAMWTKEHFGAAATGRYSRLIRQAMRDLKADPRRFGTKARFDLAPDIYVYHLSHSKDHMLEDRMKVKAPRHFIVFRLTDVQLEFARLLHDSRDLVRHLPAPV